jgi:hypothetical protein
MPGSWTMLFHGSEERNSYGQEAADTKEKLEKVLMEVNTDASKCAKDGGFLALPYNKSR